MTNKPHPTKPSLSVDRFRRRAVASAATPGITDLVRWIDDDARPWPIRVEPAVADVDVVEWVAAAREDLRARVLASGALLLRGFPDVTAAVFEQVVMALSVTALLEYAQRSSPRSVVTGRIYTSTEYPPHAPIFLHNENSYQHTWPGVIAFCCMTPATTGGETPIADVRRVLARLDADPDLVEPFERLGVLYVRHFSRGAGLTWQEAFQTDDRDVVERYCRDAGIACEWTDRDGLRTRQRRPAIARHPVTGERLWFNHATFFHVSTLPDEIRESLLAAVSPDELPNNTYYGDGTPIPWDVAERLRDAYRRETVTFPWQAGDILILDNMRVAHGRSPFTGARQVLVAMAEPCHAA
jgi:alpha-ketoglutarate-dependent taurine dioxygenase